MGDTIYGYMQAAAATAPVAKFTDANAGQSTVMDNIAAAVDLEAVIILDRPSVIEFNSPTIEIGQSYLLTVAKSSSIFERVLFETSEGRMAFMENVLPQWGAIPPALGIPIQPETKWVDDHFEAGIASDRVAIEEIDAAPDVQTRIILRDPLIQYILSPTIRVGEVVMLVNFPETTEAVRVYISNSLQFIDFVHKFVIPLATAVSIARPTVNR